MRARLVSLDGGPAVEIDKDLTIVGRDDHCDVKLDHKSVSKLHCVIVRTDGLLLLRDLGSTNGTRVNGTRVRRAALLPNDVLAVATLRYTVKFGVEGMKLVPAGTDEPDSGHHHLLIDTKIEDYNAPIPADAQHIHYGKAQTEGTIELSPGKHTLQDVFADKNHIPHEPPVQSDVITITVE